MSSQGGAVGREDGRASWYVAVAAMAAVVASIDKEYLEHSSDVEVALTDVMGRAAGGPRLLWSAMMLVYRITFSTESPARTLKVSRGDPRTSRTSARDREYPRDWTTANQMISRSAKNQGVSC